MNTPDTSIITDPARPRPVRVAAFIGALAQAILVTLSIALKLDPVLVGSILGVILVGQLGGWLLVEHAVTPISDPAVGIGNDLVRLVPKSGGSDPKGTWQDSYNT